MMCANQKIKILTAILMIYSCGGVLSINSKNNCLNHEQGDRVGLLKKETFAEIRQKMFQIRPIAASKENDTFFSLDFYELESGITHSRIWGMKDTINYTYHGNRFHFSHTSIFTTKTCKIVSNWDTSAMAKITMRQNNLDTVFAQRVIIKNENCRIERFQFKLPIFD